MSLVRKLLVAAAAAVLASAPASAAEESKGPAAAQPATKSRRTVLHFGEDDIRGDITRPDGELVQAPRRVSQNSLLRVRRSFVDRALTAPLHGR